MSHFVLDARTATPHFPGIGRYATNLARALGGPCYCLAELRAVELYRTVRNELDSQEPRIPKTGT